MDEGGGDDQHHTTAAIDRGYSDNEHLLPRHLAVVPKVSLGLLPRVECVACRVDRGLEAELWGSPQAGGLRDVAGLIHVLYVWPNGGVVSGSKPIIRASQSRTQNQQLQNSGLIVFDVLSWCTVKHDMGTRR